MRTRERGGYAWLYECDWAGCAEQLRVTFVDRAPSLQADAFVREHGWTGGRYGWRCFVHAKRQTNHVHRTDKGVQA